jgi:pimeloyl-ACP methyl ester carboxylesterase
MPPGPFSPAPEIAESRDGTPIAYFEVLAGGGAAQGDLRRRPPLLLVHGAAADHTTWRAAGPRLARRRPVFAMDRRGRGASGDAPGAAYSIEREYEDVAAIADALAARADLPAIDVAGHSYGGRASLGASLATESIRRVVVYEGAPVPPGTAYGSEDLTRDVRAALDRGDPEAALSMFLQGIVGLSDAALQAYRNEPVWPARVAAAPTILREIEAEAGAAASVETLGLANVPVLLLLGSVSRSPFRIGTDALAERLKLAQIRVIKGAAHAAHHTHVDRFVREVENFLDR